MSIVSHYPISQFLNRLIELHGPSPEEFVQWIGHRNIDRGLRRLEPWLERGDGYDNIIKQIASVRPEHAEELEKALSETKAIKSAEWDAEWLEQCKAEAATFVPFIHADGETTVPSGITLFGLTGGHERWTTIPIPKTVLNLPLEDQVMAVPTLMLAYGRKYKGSVPFFGKLTGFRLVQLLDCYSFDKVGVFIEHVDEPFRPGSCSVELR